MPVTSAAQEPQTQPPAPPAGAGGAGDKPHAHAADAVAAAFSADAAQGLTDAEAHARREKHGPNALPEAPRKSAGKMLAEQFASLIVGLLVVAAVAAAISGEYAEAVAIGVVLVVNALIGFFTEWKARQALDALREQARATARVRRGGREATVDAADLVPGDIVLVAAGDRIPADARIVTAGGLKAEESALTGESAPVEKSPAPVPEDAPLAERHSMLYLGTSVSTGRAAALVTATGPHTELGRIGKLVAETESEDTPLERELDKLGKRLVYLVVGIAAAVFALGYARGLGAAKEGGILRLAETAISLAVAAVPEGLPAVTTLVLALGVLRMARQNAIVRKLSAVETLGSTTVICSDKTGTLTQNRMTVRQLRLADGGEITVSDDGKAPSAAAEAAKAADSLTGGVLRAAVLCNDASFDPRSEGDARSNGDPTETALLLAAADAFGIDVPALRGAYQEQDEIPFESETKRMITVHGAPEGGTFYALKGAPSAVLDACRDYAAVAGGVRPLDEDARQQFLAANDGMAADALRVLGLAEKRSDAAQTGAERERGYTFLGLIGMIDPPRPEAADAVRRAHEAGIRTVMITGDQVSTAAAIARGLRLGEGERADEPRARHARDLEGVQGEALAAMARDTDVFARVSPEHKLRIVEALQQAGEVVAVTGDGVNDAPALKRADIGVAMGERGTEVAKEAADVVLTDDNFTTIVRAVEGGRTIYANILKFVHLLFTANLSEVLVIFVAVAVGLPLPLLPLQILWVNLVTDVMPALALAVEPPDADVMRRKPRAAGASLLSRPFLGLVAWQGALLGAVVLLCYWWALREYGPGAHARTVALLTLVGVQVSQMFNCRSQTGTAFSGLGSNPYLWAATAAVLALQLVLVYVPPLARIMGVTAPTGTDWLIALAAFVGVVLVVEAVKAVQRGRGGEPATA